MGAADGVEPPLQVYATCACIQSNSGCPGVMPGIYRFAKPPQLVLLKLWWRRTDSNSLRVNLKMVLFIHVAAHRSVAAVSRAVPFFLPHILIGLVSVCNLFRGTGLDSNQLPVD